jgi:hypothetical protein
MDAAPLSGVPAALAARGGDVQVMTLRDSWALA